MIEKRRVDGDPVRADEILDDANDLRQQILLVTLVLPVGFDLLVNIAGGLEDDPLGAVFSAELFQVDLGNPVDIRLAVYNGRVLGETCADESAYGRRPGPIRPCRGLLRELRR